MANEIYCKTWWGDAPNTARSMDVEPNCSILDGQLEMQKRVESESAVQESTFCASRILNGIANI